MLYIHLQIYHFQATNNKTCIICSTASTLHTAGAVELKQANMNIQ